MDAPENDPFYQIVDAWLDITGNDGREVSVTKLLNELRETARSIGIPFWIDDALMLGRTFTQRKDALNAFFTIQPNRANGGTFYKIMRAGKDSRMPLEIVRWMGTARHAPVYLVDGAGKTWAMTCSGTPEDVRLAQQLLNAYTDEPNLKRTLARLTKKVTQLEAEVSTRKTQPGLRLPKFLP